MMQSDRTSFPNMTLSHVEFYVHDVLKMETFYTQYLGFVVTDRENGMVFLSRNPEEHHQLVLNAQPSYRATNSPVDHLSFRVSSISDLRVFSSALKASEVGIQTVSHGTTWSIYFHDPEGNRIEVFADTPWYVNQPCKFTINLELSDEELYKFTEHKIQNLPGFKAVEDWRKLHMSSVDHEN